jgi:hypothetical protein
MKWRPREPTDWPGWLFVAIGVGFGTVVLLRLLASLVGADWETTYNIVGLTIALLVAFGVFTWGAMRLDERTRAVQPTAAEQEEAARRFDEALRELPFGADATLTQDRLGKPERTTESHTTERIADQWFYGEWVLTFVDGKLQAKDRQ